MVGLWYCNQSGVTELLIMRDPHYQGDYGRMCLKSVKTLGALHSQLLKRPRPEDGEMNEMTLPSRHRSQYCGKPP